MEVQRNLFEQPAHETSRMKDVGVKGVDRLYVIDVLFGVGASDNSFFGELCG